MSQDFNPYHKWLGILPEEHPPSLYRLLGIAPFESDADVIENAADRQTSHLRGYQSGKHSAASQKLLNEVAQARVTLLNPVDKLRYDQQLRTKTQATTPATEVIQPLAPVFAPSIATSGRRGTFSKTSPRRNVPLIAGAAGAGILLLLVIVFAVMNLSGGGREQPRTAAKVTSGTEPRGEKAANSPPATPAKQAISTKLPAPGNAQSQVAPNSLTQPDTPPVDNRSPSQPIEPPREVASTTATAPVADGLPAQLTIALPGDVSIEFVLIPAGDFYMGTPKHEREMSLAAAQSRNDTWASSSIPGEGPSHRVSITRPFYLGRNEVTQAQWKAVTGDSPSQFAGAEHPVDSVSWNDAQEFLEKLNKTAPRQPPMAGLGDSALRITYALPTEAQWEYACRAGTDTAYSFGDDAALLSEYGWVGENSNGTTHPVGQRKPNAWGLYDMHGNVWEWCADRYDRNYYSSSPPAQDPTGPSAGNYRVSRGGSWEAVGDARSAFRGYTQPHLPANRRGLRIALTIAN